MYIYIYVYIYIYIYIRIRFPNMFVCSGYNGMLYSNISLTGPSRVTLFVTKYVEGFGTTVFLKIYYIASTSK